MPNKLKIAVTGGIGSGKSTAVAVIKSLGFSVYDLDRIYKDILQDENFVRKISYEMNVEPLVEGGVLSIDRKKISEKVYSDTELLKKLNDLTHPAIVAEFIRRAAAEEKSVFCEVPLLYESGLKEYFDYVIVIMRGVEERIAAVKSRDGKSREEILRVIENQTDYTNLRADAHTIFIENDGDVDKFKEKIESVVREITR
ncbi:MAG: dephospho-CoA kinase [Clostridia bacterium]|nr:dephospho-CoA kinase [Clostridia bacterium]